MAFRLRVSADFPDQGKAASAAVAMYSRILSETTEGQAIVQSMLQEIHEHGYRHLACTCPLDTPCHVDVLLRQVNAMLGN